MKLVGMWASMQREFCTITGVENLREGNRREPVKEGQLRILQRQDGGTAVFVC